MFLPDLPLKCAAAPHEAVIFIGNSLKLFVLLQMNSGIIIPCKRTRQERQISSDNDSVSLYFGLWHNQVPKKSVNTTVQL